MNVCVLNSRKSPIIPMSFVHACFTRQEVFSDRITVDINGEISEKNRRARARLNEFLSSSSSYSFHIFILLKRRDKICRHCRDEKSPVISRDRNSKKKKKKGKKTCRVIGRAVSFSKETYISAGRFRDFLCGRSSRHVRPRRTRALPDDSRSRVCCMRFSCPRRISPTPFALAVTVDEHY